MDDTYIVVKMIEGWVVSRPDEHFFADMKFASEEETRLTLSAMGYEYVSGNGIAAAQIWKNASR